MDVSLYQAAAAMSAIAQWQDLIAENLSVAAVPGARKQDISFSDVQVNAATNPFAAQNTNYLVPVATSVTNFQQGELKATGSPMDFALEGPGFFSVQLPGGETGYTRDGQFHLNAQGRLVSKQGYTVMGQGGGPLQTNPAGPRNVTISATGDVSQGDQALGKLKLVEFKNLKTLSKADAGVFRTQNPATDSVPAVNTSVHQGFIEAANASPTLEMASLITAMRMFESNQKVLEMQSDRMSRVITDLSGTS